MRLPMLLYIYYNTTKHAYFSLSLANYFRITNKPASQILLKKNTHTYSMLYIKCSELYSAKN